MNLEKIPATVVTGFLGSGKTTLLSHIIKQANGKRIAVIVNEFGEPDIDADLLRSCPLDFHDRESPAQTSSIPENGVYELANGCICCTVEEDFLPVMKQLVERGEDIDHILIETSGLALPKPLVQAFNWPEIKQHCTVDSVITVVDGSAIAEGCIAHDPDPVKRQREADDSLYQDSSLKELLEDQLGSADMILISKVDLLKQNEIDSIKNQINHLVKPQVKMLEVNHGEIRCELIMGLGCATEDGIENIHRHHYAHDDFNSVSVTLGEVNADKLLLAIDDLISTRTIYRVKGFLALPGEPMRQVLQGVGERIDQYFDRAWRDDELRQSKLVFIGKDLIAVEIQRVLEAAQI